MNPLRRFSLFEQNRSQPPAPSAVSFAVCPIGSPTGGLAWQQWHLYQAAYAQARAVLQPPRHYQLVSCLN